MNESSIVEMAVTEEERTFLMEYRKKKFAKRRTQAVWLMEVAMRFEIWCAENDRDNGFSTFCNDFGFSTHLDRGDVYAKVIRLINFAHTLADGMAAEDV